MKTLFGTLHNGEQVSLYTLRCGQMVAEVTDLGATLVRLFVPDRQGNVEDVVLGYDDPNDYLKNDGFLGAVVGRNANRIKNSAFELNGKVYSLTPNENKNNLHSGPDHYHTRIWKTEYYDDTKVSFLLESPHEDQGFPGNAVIRVEYSLEAGGILRLTYDAISDRDTVFNLTNHSYFNLAGHNKPERAMDQMLSMPARFFNPDDAENIPTGESRSVEGTPMDFRSPKVIGRDIDQDYDALNLQGGYDHNFEVFTDPCAILSDPVSGRTMAVSTDCPGVQLYAGNYLDNVGKEGVHYTKRSGVCLETQYFPNSVNHAEWKQPFVKAGEHYHSVTKFTFK